MESTGSQTHAFTRDEQVAGRLLVLTLIVSTAYFLVFFTFTTIQKIVTITPDDAFYFLKIAENIVSGQGMTFDGLHRTNGFQPLWLIVLLPFCAIGRNSPETMAHISLVIEVVLISASAVFLYFPLARLFSRRALFLGVLLFIPLLMLASVKGLESAVLILTVAGLFFYGWRARVFACYRPGTTFVFGVLHGLVLLGRLDMIFLSAGIYAILIVRFLMDAGQRGKLFAQMLVMGLGVLVVVAPYVVYNFLTFGHVMPISGALKSTFPVVTFPSSIVEHLLKRKPAVVLTAVIYAVWVARNVRNLVRWDQLRAYYHLSMAALAISVILHYTNITLFMPWATSDGWHSITYNLFLVVVLAEICHKLLASRMGAGLRYVYWAGTAVVVLFLGYRVYAKTAGDIRDYLGNVPSYEAAQWARSHTDPADLFALNDAGVFSYFSGRHVINLDGLVNSFDYQEVLRDQHLHRYLQQNGVKYIGYHAVWDVEKQWGRYQLAGDYGVFKYPYFSHKYRTHSDAVVNHQEDEVFRSNSYRRQEGYLVGLIFWKYRMAG